MGKVVKFTGSRLLGAELARLRGDRSMDQIAAISRSRPFAERCRSVSAPSLCQIESGQTLPNLDTLYTLSCIYHVPMQHLLDLLVEERLASRALLPEGLDATRERSVGAYASGEWHDAIALALHGERVASTEEERVRWRAYRATCMARVGMQREALFLLLDCAHSPHAPRERLSHVHALLAETLATCGYLAPAADSARLALVHLAADAPAVERMTLLATRAGLLVSCHEAGLERSDAVLVEALDLLDRARPLAAGGDPRQRLTLDVLAAVAHGRLGRATAALASLAVVRAEAAKLRHVSLEVLAMSQQGEMLKLQGRRDEARARYEEAERLAIDAALHEQVFECAFELMTMAHGRDDAAHARHRRRCQRYFPLVHARTPRVLAFEATLVSRRA